MGKSPINVDDSFYSPTLAFDIPVYPGRTDGDTVRMRTQAKGGLDPIYGPGVAVTAGTGPFRAKVRSLTLRALAVSADALEFAYEVRAKDGTVRTSQAISYAVERRVSLDHIPAPVILGGLDADGKLDSNAKVLSVRIDRPERGWPDDMMLFVVGSHANVEAYIPTNKDFFHKIDAASVAIEIGPAQGLDFAGSKGEALRIWCRGEFFPTMMISDVLTLRIAGDAPPPKPLPLSAGEDRFMHVEPYCVLLDSPPPNPPPQAVLKQPATGGKPPFTYKSSNSMVAAVAADGTVVTCGNGVTSISVSDANGDVSSYRLEVDGAVVHALISQNTPGLDTASNKITRQGAIAAMESAKVVPGLLTFAWTLPKLGHLRMLRRQYDDGKGGGLAARLGLPQDSDATALYWSIDTSPDNWLMVNLNASSDSEAVVSTKDGATTAFFLAQEVDQIFGYKHQYDAEYGKKK
jgi:hypothetical protein